MIALKCKMCGGDLSVSPDSPVGTCEYCGSTMTLPHQTDEQKTNQFNRANHFRRANQFDKAAGIYDMILNADNNDAEAHWGAVLCRYGIEYVEDPETKKMVPTCHRTRLGSVLADEDYKLAIKNADYSARALYEEEAQRIDEIQKEILEISKKEEPFDVFICYKESDDSGRRTPDSVLAQEIYYELVEQGYKVFFSRITLEDKLGTAYEPYIFAALNSAKVMLVLGTRPEYFQAVWVRNEWARYLAMIQDGAEKLLIPAYKDMDPYELPDEFSHLQSQDMSKIGFIQDLVRGIQKITAEPEPVSPIISTSAEVEALVKRGYIFLEDHDMDMAGTYFNKALDRAPEYSEAYWGLLLIAHDCMNDQELLQQQIPLDDDKNFQKAIRFAPDPDNKYTKINQQLHQIHQNKIDAQMKRIALLEEEISLVENDVKELQNKIDNATEKKEALETKIDTLKTQLYNEFDERHKQLAQKKALLLKEYKKISIFSITRKKEILESLDKIYNAMEKLVQLETKKKEEFKKTWVEGAELERLKQQIYTWTIQVNVKNSEIKTKKEHLDELRFQLEMPEHERI